MNYCQCALRENGNEEAVGFLVFSSAVRCRSFCQPSLFLLPFCGQRPQMDISGKCELRMKELFSMPFTYVRSLSSVVFVFVPDT